MDKFTRRYRNYCLAFIIIMFGIYITTMLQVDSRPLLAVEQDLHPTKSIRLPWKSRLFTIKAPSFGGGLELNDSDETQERKLVLSCDGEIGRVVDFSATVRTSPNKSFPLIAIVLGSQNSETEKIEYRLLIGGGPCGDDIKDVNHWVCSSVLIDRPVNQPFSGMAVTNPMGDSIVSYFMELTRKGRSNDQIDIHVFVNHCPICDRKRIDEATSHHVITTDKVGVAE